MVNIALSTCPVGDSSNDNVTRHEEKGATEGTNHGVASLLDGCSNMSLELIHHHIAGSEETVHLESS